MSDDDHKPWPLRRHLAVTATIATLIALFSWFLDQTRMECSPGSTAMAVSTSWVCMADTNR